MVQAGSCFLTPAESRYAIIELELLAVAWAFMKHNMFLQYIPCRISTDYISLVPILNSHQLDEIDNSRLQCLQISLQFHSSLVQG